MLNIKFVIITGKKITTKPVKISPTQLIFSFEAWNSKTIYKCKLSEDNF